MKIINLLPQAEQREARLHFFSKQLVSFWLWILISLALFLIGGIMVRIYLTQQSAQVEMEIATKSDQLKSSDNEQLKNQIDQLNNQIDNIRNLTKQHYRWSQALVELANMTPAGMHYTSIVMNRLTGEVDLTGTADNRSSILQFWSNVHKSKYYSDINFPLANLDQANNDPFTFSMHVNRDQITQAQ